MEAISIDEFDAKFNEPYGEIADIADEETAIKLHEIFKGRNVKFPKRLYSKHYISKYVTFLLKQKGYDLNDSRDYRRVVNHIISDFDYCEQTARKKLKEVKEEDIS